MATNQTKSLLVPDNFPWDCKEVSAQPLNSKTIEETFHLERQGADIVVSGSLIKL